MDDNHNVNIRIRFDQKCWAIFKNNAYIFAYVLAIVIIPACFVPYVVSVYFGQVPPILPYISDAAAFKPATGYFAQLLDIIVMLGALVCIARFKQIHYYISVVLDEQKNSIDENKLSRLHLQNFLSLASFAIAGFGMVMIGNFPGVDYMILHMTGVYLFIIFSLIQHFIMISIMRKLYRYGRLESHPTSVIIVVSTLFVSITVCHVAVSISYVHHPESIIFNHNARIQWQANQPGYVWHVVSTASEFVYFLMFVPYFWSIGHRMQSFKQWDRIHF
ncbi:autophagy modulator [Dermatophagoides farinae]|uniref:Autophagy modulator n=2 Tax=Dermatophagoides farinae TaxID=6954 RepID=A0A922HNS9_DERFA|nr:hypothetical protein HUG17_6815 [Dermatophagoides farinae]KAH9493561.1 autophagy modulator [Dermatophagoides farinae]